MIPSPYHVVRFPEPVTLRLTVGRTPRPRVVAPDSSPAASQPSSPMPVVEKAIQAFPMTLTVNPLKREIAAQLSPIPGRLVLYVPDDYAAACADSMEDHCQRVVDLCGADPAAMLQSLIDGSPLPPLPPRVPREIANWRAKAVLSAMGLLDQVNAVISKLPEPDRTMVLLAWNGDAKLARRGQTVLSIAAALSMSDSEINQLFIQADSIQI